MSSAAGGKSLRRQPSAVPGPKPPCSIHPSAIISDQAIITGTLPVSIGENTVIHPYAKISSAVGAVRIGKNCIIAERSTVGLSDKPGTLSTGAPVVEIEDGVSIETGAIVQAEQVGTGSVVGVNAVLGPGVVTGEFCKVSACSRISSGHLPDYTIVYGEGSRRVDSTAKTRPDVRDLKLKGQLLHIETLKRLIPSNTMKWQS